MNRSSPTYTRKAPFRILLMNLGYATGLDGSMKSYLFGSYRYLYTPRRIIRQIRQSIYGLLNRVQPDICCFVEIHRKHGFVPHPHAYTSHIDNKYGRRSLLRFLPFFRNNCNGFISHQPLQFEKHYFKNGSKKLIYDIKIGKGMSLLLVHFSLARDTRRRQCQELKKILANRSNTIVCGDFNIFEGERELHALAEACNLKIVETHQHTFPAVRPTKTLDLFLCPKGMAHVSAQVMDDVRVSDHLPVMLTLSV